MIPGHTKFLPDSHFGAVRNILKNHYGNVLNLEDVSKCY